MTAMHMTSRSTVPPVHRRRNHQLRRAGQLILVIAAIAGSAIAGAAETIKKLTAAQIRASAVGMDFIDEVHWAIQHFRDGQVKSFHMGQGDSGTWRLDGGTICVDYVKAGKECHEVWRSGSTLQLRRTNSGTVLEGVLVKHEKRG